MVFKMNIHPLHKGVNGFTLIDTFELNKPSDLISGLTYYFTHFYG